MTKKIKGPQIIIANRLSDGRVVFLNQQGGWSVTVQAAAIAHDEAQLDSLLDKVKLAETANLVVSAEPVDAILSGGGAFGPGHIKQQLQSRGPSVRPDLGYQAGESIH